MGVERGCRNPSLAAVGVGMAGERAVEGRAVTRFFAWLLFPRWLWTGPYWLRSANSWWLANVWGRLFFGDRAWPTTLCPGCGGDAGDNWFDRSLCSCRAMHTRCRNCGVALDDCDDEAPSLSPTTGAQ